MNDSAHIDVDLLEAGQVIPVPILEEVTGSACGSVTYHLAVLRLIERIERYRRSIGKPVIIRQRGGELFVCTPTQVLKYAKRKALGITRAARRTLEALSVGGTEGLTDQERKQHERLELNTAARLAMLAQRAPVRVAKDPSVQPQAREPESIGQVIVPDTENPDEECEDDGPPLRTQPRPCVMVAEGRPAADERRDVVVVMHRGTRVGIHHNHSAFREAAATGAYSQLTGAVVVRLRDGVELSRIRGSAWLPKAEFAAEASDEVLPPVEEDIEHAN